MSPPVRHVPRVTTLGEFELHVQSVRAARNDGVQHGLPAVPRAAVLPPYSLGTDELPQYTNPKAFTNDKSSLHSPTFDEKIKPSNRTTSDNEEPKTVARFLFFYGFLMPLLWIIGASIIFLELKYYPDVLTDVEDPRTDEERAADLQVIRRAEIKWAWRSLYAIISLLLILLIVILTYLGVTNKWTGVHS